MAVFGMSAKGERVDFDLLKIKQQLASNPVNVNVQDRRKIIDVKNGLKPREVNDNVVDVKKNALKIIDTSNEEVNEAFAIALQAAQVSAEVSTKETYKESIQTSEDTDSKKKK